MEVRKELFRKEEEGCPHRASGNGESGWNGRGCFDLEIEDLITYQKRKAHSLHFFFLPLHQNGL